MAKYSIDDSTLIAIGDAIREKNGTSETMTPAEMAAAISAIEAGGGYDEGYAAGKAISDAIIDRTIAEIESNVSEVKANVFYGCEALVSAVFPEATMVFDAAFRECTSLVTVDLPKALHLRGSSFRGCINLKKIDLPNLVQVFASVFQGCSTLETVILRADKLCTISNTNVFAGTPIEGGTGFIFVPDNLLDQYRTATNWSTLANQIRAIEDYPDIVGG